MDVIQMTPGNKDGQQRAIGKEELLGKMKSSIKELQGTKPHQKRIFLGKANNGNLYKTCIIPRPLSCQG